MFKDLPLSNLFSGLFGSLIGVFCVIGVTVWQKKVEHKQHCVALYESLAHQEYLRKHSDNWETIPVVALEEWKAFIHQGHFSDLDENVREDLFYYFVLLRVAEGVTSPQQRGILEGTDPKQANNLLESFEGYLDEKKFLLKSEIERLKKHYEERYEDYLAGKN